MYFYLGSDSDLEIPNETSSSSILIKSTPQPTATTQSATQPTNTTQPNPDKRSHHREKYIGTKVIIPPDINSRPSIVAVAARMNVNPTQQSALVEAVIKECGGDISKVATSYAYTDRARKPVVKDVSRSIQQEWVPPKAATLGMGMGEKLKH